MQTKKDQFHYHQIKNDRTFFWREKIFNFELMAEDEKEKKMCKGIITNMLNRIIVMMDEEMCFIEYEKYVVIRKYMEKYERGNRGNFIDLYKICKI